MTRKDYNVIAYRMAMAEPALGQNIAREAWWQCCKSVAGGLEQDNPRFRRGTFLDACHFDYWTSRAVPR